MSRSIDLSTLKQRLAQLETEAAALEQKLPDIQERFSAATAVAVMNDQPMPAAPVELTSSQDRLAELTRAISALRRQLPPLELAARTNAAKTFLAERKRQAEEARQIEERAIVAFLTAVLITHPSGTFEALDAALAAKDAVARFANEPVAPGIQCYVTELAQLMPDSNDQERRDRAAALLSNIESSTSEINFEELTARAAANVESLSHV